MINNLLIVCIGNICRSPAAEKLLQQQLGNINVSSAGLAAMAGAGIDAQMLHCLAATGIEGVQHVARQLTRELVQQADLVLAMERDHVKIVLQLAPEAAGKTMLLGKWNNNEEIEDPYRCSDEFFQLVYAKIQRNVDLWAGKLNAGTVINE